MRVKILYASNSGNTKAVANIVERQLNKLGHFVSSEDVRFPTFDDLSNYHVILFGTFTRGVGELPRHLKKYIGLLTEKPPIVAVFGTGDTQWGEMYCHAAHKLHKFFNSPDPVLEIEQYPDEAQYLKIMEWTKELMIHHEINESTCV